MAMLGMAMLGGKCAALQLAASLAKRVIDKAGVDGAGRLAGRQGAADWIGKRALAMQT